MKGRYAITGSGAVSPVGVGFDAFARAVRANTPAPDGLYRGQPTVLDPERIPDAVAAEVWDFDAAAYLGKKGLRNFDRLTRFLIVAAKFALEHAGIKRDGEHLVPPERLGVCSATAYGSLDVITEMVKVAELEAPHFLNPARFPNTVINSAAGYVSIWEDLRAPNVTVVDGNCGSLDAVLTAETHLMHDRADAFLVGGGEVLSEPLYLAFRKLELLAEGDRRAQPGAPDSPGMHMSEGGAYVVLERYADALARKASVLAEVIGYGNVVEPPESEAIIVHGSAVAVERALRMALSDAGIDASEVDLVVSSVSGIPQFDGPELTGIEVVFGDVPVVAPKAYVGETFGAGGALGMAAALAYMGTDPARPGPGGPDGHGIVPPPIRGAWGPDRPPPATLAVVAAGYYGNASAVLLRRPRD